MNTNEKDNFIRSNWDVMSYKEIAEHIGSTAESVRHRGRKALGLPPRRTGVQTSPEWSAVATDQKINRLSQTKTVTERKYNELLEQHDQLQREVDAVRAIKEVSTYTIKPTKSKSEATAFLIASDWHFEERVESDVVNGLNNYDLNIARARSQQFFQNGLTLLNITKRDVKIKTLVLALLGDFISGSIHDELAETNQLPPVLALVEVEKHIVSGIQFLLDNSDVDIVVPCHSGNHGRTTVKQRHASERGNSFEYYMYHHIAAHFKDNKRVTFIISSGYHSYLTTYDYTVRFHHGHSIRYGGGVGGIYIPTYKAIAQWDIARRADLDVFGHFHQFRDGGQFICNGSMIGYNAYALSIKAGYEPPKQTFFLVDKKRGKTIVAPILFNS